MKKIALLITWLCFTQLVRAELPLSELYGLREERALRQLIEQEQQDSASPERVKRLGIAWHNLAVLEQSGAANKAFALLSKLYETTPKDNEVLAYLGSAKIMVARDSWNFLSKISEVNKGIALLDKAVANEKDNVVIRIVRVNNSLALPGFLSREKKAKQDLNYLVELFKHVEATPEELGEVYYKLGQLLAKASDNTQSAVYFKQTIQASPQTNWAKLAQEALND
jgi:tetratricopeptide (TPR) repeat protein